MKQLANVAKLINSINMHAEVTLYLGYASYFLEMVVIRLDYIQ